MKPFLHLFFLMPVFIASSVGVATGQTASQPYVVSHPTITTTTTTTIQTQRTVSLQTNLLYDLALVPNIGIELPFGRHFSAGAQVAWADWERNNTYALKASLATLDLTYWFTPRQSAPAGWNIGVYGLYGGRFDVQWTDGYQGDNVYSTGLSGGYSLPLSRHFSLAFSVAGGYVYSPEVRHYHQRGNYLVWEETRYNFSTFSLTRLQVNLVWNLRFNRPN